MGEGSIYFSFQDEEHKGKKLPLEVWKKLSSNRTDEAQEWLRDKKNQTAEEINRYGYYRRSDGNSDEIIVDKGNPMKDDEVNAERVQEFKNKGLIQFNGNDCIAAAELMSNEQLPSERHGDGVRAAYGFSVAGNAGPYFEYIREDHVDHIISKPSSFTHHNPDIVHGLLGHILWGLGNGKYALQSDIVSKRMIELLELKDHNEYFNKLKDFFKQITFYKFP